jgi:two-component system chemotaxis response regulator CheY
MNRIDGPAKRRQPRNVVPSSAPVLLVEDNDDTRGALARLLRIRGYRVAEARDGQEAWEYLGHGERACVIVLDLVMPRMDGRLFRAKQLEHSELAAIPVVVFTAHESGELPDVAWVVRKADPDWLLDVIDRATGGPALIGL